MIRVNGAAGAGVMTDIAADTCRVEKLVRSRARLFDTILILCIFVHGCGVVTGLLLMLTGPSMDRP